MTKEQKEKRYTELISIESFIHIFKLKFVESSWKSVEEVRDYSWTDEELSEKSKPLVKLFTEGFCYYFALMLKEAYPGGTICKPWPIGHFIYKYQDKYYDIDGEYILNEHDCEMAIPFKLPYFVDAKYMRLHKLDYLHVVDYDHTKADEVRNYKLYGVTLDKTEMVVLVYVLYNLHRGYLFSDETELSMINCYFKWFTEDNYIKVKDIATKLLQSKQLLIGEEV